jgi:hypothetical protein
VSHEHKKTKQNPKHISGNLFFFFRQFLFFFSLLKLMCVEKKRNENKINFLFIPLTKQLSLVLFVASLLCALVLCVLSLAISPLKKENKIIQQRK